MRFNSIGKAFPLIIGALSLTVLPAHAVGLMQAYEEALRNDPTYQGAIHEHDASQENRTLGRSNLLPSLSLNYSKNKNRADAITPDVLGQLHNQQDNYSSSSGSLTLRQPLLNLEGYARYRQGVAQAEYGDAQFASKAQDLKLRIAGSYFDALYAQDQLALVTAQRDALLEQMRVNAKLFEKGEGTKTDMLETQAKLDVAEAQLVESRDNVAASLQTISAIVGKDVKFLDPLREDFKVHPLLPATVDEWKAIALANNPDIAALRHGVEIAEQEITKGHAGHLPRLDFVANLEKDKSSTFNTLNEDIKTRSVGFQLSIPLYSGGSVNAATAQAIANRAKAQSDLDAKIGQIGVELHKDISALQNSLAKIDALEKSVKSSQLLVKATEQSIKGGVRINLDLLNARQQEFTALRELAMARYTYLLTSLRLRSSAGVLSEEDLRATAAYFATAN